MSIVDYWPILVCTFIGQLIAGWTAVFIKHKLDFRLRRKFITHYESFEAGKGKGKGPPNGQIKPSPPPQPPEVECQGCLDSKQYKTATPCACCHGRRTIPKRPELPPLRKTKI